MASTNAPPPPADGVTPRLPLGSLDAHAVTALASSPRGSRHEGEVSAAVADSGAEYPSPFKQRRLFGDGGSPNSSAGGGTPRATPGSKRRREEKSGRTRLGEEDPGPTSNSNSSAAVERSAQSSRRDENQDPNRPSPNLGEKTTDDVDLDQEEDDFDLKGDGADEVVGRNQISLRTTPFQRNAKQAAAFSEVLDHCVAGVKSLGENGHGSLILPFSKAWNDIAVSKLTQLGDYVGSSSPHASVYLVGESRKGGSTLNSGKRWLLGYSETKSLMPILYNGDTQNLMADTHLSSLVTNLFERFGSTLFQGRDFRELSCQNLFDMEACGVGFNFSLFCNIMHKLRGNEPAGIRKRIAMLILESGIQQFLGLEKESSQHEWVSRSNKDLVLESHERCARKANQIIEALALTVSEVDYIQSKEVQPRSLLNWRPGIKHAEVGVREEDEWSEFPPFTPLVTSSFLGKKNTPGDVVMTDIVTTPPPGDDPYNADAYLDETLVDGFDTVWLPYVKELIESSVKVTVRTFVFFEQMWKAVEKANDGYRNLSRAIVANDICNSFHPGLNDVMVLMSFGFKPVYIDGNEMVCLTLRKEGKLKIAFVHKTVTWSGYAGLDLKRYHLDSQTRRTETAYSFQLLFEKFRQTNATTLTIDAKMGERPVKGNLLIGQSIRQWAVPDLHTSPVLGTLLQKVVLVDLDTALKHRLVYGKVDGTIIARNLRVYERAVGDSGAMNSDLHFQQEFVGSLTFSSHFMSLDDAMKVAFDQLLHRKGSGEEFAFGTAKNRYDVVKEYLSGPSRAAFEECWRKYLVGRLGERDTDNFEWYEGYRFLRQTNQLSDGTEVFLCYCSHWNRCNMRLYRNPGGRITRPLACSQPSGHHESCTQDGKKPNGFLLPEQAERPSNVTWGGYNYNTKDIKKKHTRYICKHRRSSKESRCTAYLKWPHKNNDGSEAGMESSTVGGEHDARYCQPVGCHWPKQQTVDSTRQVESERENGPTLFLQGLDLRTQERLRQASQQFYLGQINQENNLQQLDFNAMCSVEDFPDRSTAKVNRLEEQLSQASQQFYLGRIKQENILHICNRTLILKPHQQKMKGLGEIGTQSPSTL